MIAWVELERVVDNPYQTRQVYDEAGVRELAEDIWGMREARPETGGLIQVPLGRVVLMDGGMVDPGDDVAGYLKGEIRAVVELAAGHRRARAFRWLERRENGRIGSMPVDVVVLDDQAMADIAWSENAQRKDLSAVEEGAAIRRAMDEFGYSLKEVSKRWGLSVSAASNKMRLLELPEGVQELVRSGELGERHAREILPIVQVGQNGKRAVELGQEAVRYGTTAAGVADQVQRELMRMTRPIPAGMGEWDDWGREDIGECEARCKGCERESRGRCSRPDLCEGKVVAWVRRVVERARQQTGLLVEKNAWRTLKVGELARARERGCEYLRVGWIWSPQKSGVLVGKGLPNVYYVCASSGMCECKREPDVEEEGPTEYEVWVEAQNRRAEEIGKELLEEMRERFLTALEWMPTGDLGIFAALLDAVGGKEIERGDREGMALAMARLTAPMRIAQRRAAAAEVYRARIYGLVGIAGAVYEAKWWLEVARAEVEEARLMGRKELYKARVERALGRVREILGERDEAGLMGELGEVERLVEEFSQEKDGN